VRHQSGFSLEKAFSSSQDVRLARGAPMISGTRFERVGQDFLAHFARKEGAF
jgi:hypothetical protein